MKAKTMNRAERSQLREKQILDAAKRCFSRVGFHSTSMAQIATTAKMSVGQIYRHFRSKEALIEGIVQEDIALQLSELHGGLGASIDLITLQRGNKGIDTTLANRERLALMLEIAAEASRNRKVRDILLRHQRRGLAEFKKRLEEDSSTRWSAAELDLRLRLVSAMSQGVITQILLDPRAPVDALLKRIGEVASQMLQVPQSTA